jgi:hypothetical protein
MSVITSIDRTKLGRTYAPRLPTPPREWDDIYQNQLNNALRLYFERLDNIFASILDTAGGKFLSFPYGAFSSFDDQSALTINTPTLMTLGQTDFASSVSVESSTNIKVANPGIYNLQWSAQFQNTDSQLQDVYIWLRQGNGAGAATDITGSTGFISVPNKHGAVNGHTIVGWNYYLSMQANDYVQLVWSTGNLATTIQHLDAGVTPTRPSTASVVATLSFVSALPREV